MLFFVRSSRPAIHALGAFGVDAGIPGAGRWAQGVRAGSANGVVGASRVRSVLRLHDPLPETIHFASWCVVATVLDCLHGRELSRLRHRLLEGLLVAGREAEG